MSNTNADTKTEELPEMSTQNKNLPDMTKWNLMQLAGEVQDANLEQGVILGLQEGAHNFRWRAGEHYSLGQDEQAATLRSYAQDLEAIAEDKQKTYDNFRRPRRKAVFAEIERRLKLEQPES